jgi:xanthine/uracil permease
MTLGIVAGILLVLFGLKKIQKGMNSIGGQDTRWRDIVMDALFLGMISAFVGMLFADIRKGLPGFIPLAVALASALLMAVCGILMKKYKLSWLEQYALPISMLGAMALSIPITALMQ